MYKPPYAMREKVSKMQFCEYYGKKGIPPEKCGCPDCADVNACIKEAKLRVFGDANFAL